jgi:signal transduction histidine kinase
MWHAGPGGDGPWAMGPPHWRPPRALTLWLPVAISFAIQVPPAIWLAAHRALGSGPSLVVLALAVLGPLALIAARRAPGPVVAITTAAAAADLLINVRSGPPYLALAFAIVGAVVRGARLWAFISLGVGWIATIAIGLALGLDWAPGRIAIVTIGLLVVIGIAESIRTRRDRFDARRARWQRLRQDEVQAERVRIARELHDVLAHSLSQINVQAGVGLHLMDRQPEKAAEALQSIKDTSRTALEEVRGVLGVLRAEGGADPAASLVPEPDLARLPGLVEQLGVGGLKVTVDDRVGDREHVPQGVQLAVYRVAQEALTNVSRHSAARTARLLLERTAGGIRVVVDDPGPAAEAGRRRDLTGGPPGRGLLGMRERAELLGGAFSAGPEGAAGWRVAAEFPIEEAR